MPPRTFTVFHTDLDTDKEPIFSQFEADNLVEAGAECQKRFPSDILLDIYPEDEPFSRTSSWSRQLTRR